MTVKFDWINKINYKDIIIIYTLWFFAIAFNHFFNFASFMGVANLDGFFDLLFSFAARLIFISLILIYFTFIYDISIKDLGLHFKTFTKKIIPLFIYTSLLLALVLILINIPLSINKITKYFKPIYQILKIENLVLSLLPAILMLPIFFIISLSEQLMLNLFVYEIFRYKLPKIISKIFASLFFPFLIYNLKPEKIIIYFLLALISITIYERSEKSILIPSIFGAGFYLIYTFYIYGWSFI